MTLQADFASQDYFRDPTAAIEKLRATGPVVEVRFPLIGKVWTTTTQALADRVLKDTETFTVRKEDGTVAGLRWWMPPIVRTLANTMLSMDEPDHKRLRDIVDEAFRRRAVLEMEPHIQAMGDELAAELFAEGSPADLVERYARKLPLSVICELLGLPLADRPKFIAWACRLHPLHRRARIPRRDPEPLCLEALYRTAPRDRSRAGRRRVDRRDRAGREGGRTHQPERNRVDGVPVAAGRARDHHASDQRIGIRASEKSRSARLARSRTGAAPISRSRNFCASSRRCNSPSRAMCGRISSSAASDCGRATGSWPCWPPPTWIRRRTLIPNGSICSASRTGTSPSAPGSISASAISSRASKARCALKSLFQRWPKLTLGGG